MKMGMQDGPLLHDISKFGTTLWLRTEYASLKDTLWPLLLTWFNFNPSMDK